VLLKYVLSCWRTRASASIRTQDCQTRIVGIVPPTLARLFILLGLSCTQKLNFTLWARSVSFPSPIYRMCNIILSLPVIYKKKHSKKEMKLINFDVANFVQKDVSKCCRYVCVCAAGAEPRKNCNVGTCC